MITDTLQRVVVFEDNKDAPGLKVIRSRRRTKEGDKGQISIAYKGQVIIFDEPGSNPNYTGVAMVLRELLDKAVDHNCELQKKVEVTFEK